MRTPCPIVFAAVLSILAASCSPHASAPADTTQTGSADRYARPPYLSPTAVDPVALLPAPPADGSAEQQAELSLLLTLQQHRTPAQSARVTADNTLTVFNFADVLGPGFTPANCPKANAFFDQMEIAEGFFARIAKAHYHRARPTSDPRIHPVMPQGGNSYPSGHATRAALFAELLADLVPDRRDALIARGREIGFEREIAGVHYPSDVYAGRTLGRAVARALLASPDARRALDQLRPELARARATR